MKLVSVAVVAVLFCAAAVVYAAPTTGMLARYRQILTCIDGVFGEIVEKYNELERYHTEYKEFAQKENAKLDECEKSENPDECAADALATFGWFLSDLGQKIRKENEDASTALGFGMMFKCGI